MISQMFSLVLTFECCPVEKGNTRSVSDKICSYMAGLSKEISRAGKGLCLNQHTRSGPSEIKAPPL